MGLLRKKKPPAPPVKDFDSGGFDMDIDRLDRPLPPPRSRPPKAAPKMHPDFDMPHKPEMHELKRHLADEPEHHVPRPASYPSSPGPTGKSPPLFIKIDRYKEVVDEVQKLRSTAISLRDAIDALADIEKEMQTAVGMVSKAISKISMDISGLESKFSRVSATDEIELPRSADAKDIEKHVESLYDQMARIKKDLKGL